MKEEEEVTIYSFQKHDDEGEEKMGVVAKRRMALFVFLSDGDISEHFSLLGSGIRWTDLRDRKRKED